MPTSNNIESIVPSALLKNELGGLVWVGLLLLGECDFVDVDVELDAVAGLDSLPLWLPLDTNAVIPKAKNPITSTATAVIKSQSKRRGSLSSLWTVSVLILFDLVPGSDWAGSWRCSSCLTTASILMEDYWKDSILQNCLMRVNKENRPYIKFFKKIARRQLRIIQSCENL